MKGIWWLIGLLSLSVALVSGCGSGYISGSYYSGTYYPGYTPLYHYHYYPEATYYDISLDVVIGIRNISHYELESFDLFRWSDGDWDGQVDSDELSRISYWLEYSPSLQEWRLHPNYRLEPYTYYLVILETTYETRIWLFRTVGYYYGGTYYYYYGYRFKTLEKSDSPSVAQDWKKEDPHCFPVETRAKKEEVKK